MKQGASFSVKPEKKRVTRFALVARAKPFERKSKFAPRIEEAAPKCVIDGKSLQASGEYKFRYYPAFKVFGKWFRFPIWTTVLEERHYA